MVRNNAPFHKFLPFSHLYSYCTRHAQYHCFHPCSRQFLSHDGRCVIFFNLRASDAAYPAVIQTTSSFRHCFQFRIISCPLISSLFDLCSIVRIIMLAICHRTNYIHIPSSRLVGTRWWLFFVNLPFNACVWIKWGFRPNQKHTSITRCQFPLQANVSTSIIGFHFWKLPLGMVATWRRLVSARRTRDWMCMINWVYYLYQNVNPDGGYTGTKLFSV